MSIEWTHKKVSITDIRKVKKFYILIIDDKEINSPLFVDHNIFESRVNSYYLTDNNSIARSQVLEIKWNMIINKGFFYKIDRENNEEKILKDNDKFYISFLEIDGPLGTHVPG